MRISLSFLAIGALIIPLFMMIPMNVDATIDYSSKVVFCKSAYNSEYRLYHGTEFVEYENNVPDIKCYDADTFDVQGPGDNYAFIFDTTCFYNPNFYPPFIPDPYPGIEETGEPPLSNATIDWVLIEIRYSKRPNTILQYTINNWTSYNESDLYPQAYNTWLVWNVTALEDWTPDMLYSEFGAFEVRLLWYPIAGIHYYLNYVGVTYKYHYEEDIEMPPEDEETGDQIISPNFIFGDEGLKGIFGVFGFFGLIAVPGILIWQFRQGQINSKINAFVLGLTGTTMCFAMVLYAIG